MNFFKDANDALNIKNLVAKSFGIKEAGGNSTSASRSSMSSIFSSGVTKVKQGTASNQKDVVLTNTIRAFADLPATERIFQVRNLFLKALVMTFPKMDLNTALTMASVKALLSYRESGGTVSWNLETSQAFTPGKLSGWKNMNANQRYNQVVSGTGLIQWTADRHVSFLNRMGSLKGNGFDTDLAFIDPGFQSVYWAAELADKAGLNSDINGSSNQGGIFFSKDFADILVGRGTATAGEIYGAFMLWQAGAGFGLQSENQRRALIYGKSGMNLSIWTGGITAFDMYTAKRLGITGYYASSDTFTVTDFCKGIDRLVRKGKSFPYNYRPITSYFYKTIVAQKGADLYETFPVAPDEDILKIFNLK